VSYVSFGAQRAIAPIYNGDRLTPRPFIMRDVKLLSDAYSDINEFQLTAQVYNGSAWANV
jgi:hypothetical protein